jgi:hypothetical protein
MMRERLMLVDRPTAETAASTATSAGNAQLADYVTTYIVVDHHCHFIA